MIHGRKRRGSLPEPASAEPTAWSERDGEPKAVSQHATYTLSTEHLASLAAALRIPVRPHHVFNICVLVVNVLAVLSFLRGDSWDRYWMAIGVMMFHLLLIDAIVSVSKKIFIEPRRAVKKRIARWKLADLDFKVEMTAEALEIGHARWWARLRWDHICSWQCTSRMILITTRLSTNVYLIPKSISASGFDIDILLERLRSSSLQAVP
jgi:hypothetical protein